jgi:phage gp36-like protein
VPLVPLPSTLYFYAQASDLSNVGALPGFVQSLTATQISEALQTASAEIDTILGAYLQLPLTQSDPILVQACCNIAIWNLITARGYNPQNPAEEMYEKRYQRTWDLLKMWANNQARPAVAVDSSPSGGPGQATPNAGPQTVNPQTGTTATGPTTWGTWARR